ncbi:MAG: hypothetical protein HS111_40225, partial [Kofleriaceae bacterium]|nr:hypothetical protein [Kofleriaceae bacterium]
APGAALLPTLELTLAPGVRLSFSAARPATDADAAALLAAATPLLAELARRHLVSSPVCETAPARSLEDSP